MRRESSLPALLTREGVVVEFDVAVSHPPDSYDARSFAEGENLVGLRSVEEFQLDLRVALAYRTKSIT